LQIKATALSITASFAQTHYQLQMYPPSVVVVVVVVVVSPSSGSLKVRPGLAYLNYWSQGQGTFIIMVIFLFFLFYFSLLVYLSLFVLLISQALKESGPSFTCVCFPN